VASATVLGDLLGSTEPRIFTPPLRELRPAVVEVVDGVEIIVEKATSYGYAVVEFARDVLLEPLDPWEEWLVIHAGELLPDGRPRFRTLLVLVARQNGKTHLLKVLALFWLFVEFWALVVGMSTSLEYAKEAWDKAVLDVKRTPELAEMVPRRQGITDNNNKVELRIQTEDGHTGRYRIAARNRRGGRSLSIDRLIIDELREHATWDAWNAATNALNARPFGQIWTISNQGDSTSVVLLSLRAAALSFLEAGEGDERLGIFEWSAPEGASMTSLPALAMANPNLGRRIDPAALLGAARRAEANPHEVDANGVTAEASFRTEVMCQYVPKLDPAVDRVSWEESVRVGDLEGARGRLVTFFDLAPDRQHATLCAAGYEPDGRIRLEVVAAWAGPQTTLLVRRELPALLRKVNPRLFGWMPGGPAASLAPDLAGRPRGSRAIPADAQPAQRFGGKIGGAEVQEITAEVPALCMGFAALVDERGIVHSDEPLLTAHVLGAGKLHIGMEGQLWVFSRAGEGHCDAAYAAAGAAHLLMTLPKSLGKPRLVVARSSRN
jgi:hypothetical protein